MESPQYFMAKIEIPLLLYPDGKYDAYNDRANISFYKIDALPDVQTKTSIQLSELFQGIGNSAPLNHSENEDSIFRFKTTPEDEEIQTDNVGDNHIEIDTITDENHSACELFDCPLNMFEMLTDGHITLNTNLPPRKRTKVSNGDKTLKNYHNDSTQYTRKYVDEE